MHKSLIPKKIIKSPGYTINQMLNRAKVKGDVGLEIEMEGNKFPRLFEQLPPEWVYHADGSLRGHDNAEYVLNKPINFSEVRDSVTGLFKTLEKFGTKLDNSNRTSVHVHLNAQNFYLDRLTCFVSLYFSIEELLTEWCGDHRVGNLFCLRAKDAGAIVSSLKRFIEADGKYEIRDWMHYAGLNAHALTKFGSIEIRSLRGCTEPETIITWVSILQRLYELSGEFDDPREIPSLVSGEGVEAYLSRLLGENKDTVLRGISYDNSQVYEAVYKGIRIAQDLCYCRDWSLYEKVNLKDDPFNRQVKKPSPISLNTPNVGPPPVGQILNDFNPSVNWEQAMAAYTQALEGPETEPQHEEPEEEYDIDSASGYLDYEEGENEI